MKLRLDIAILLSLLVCGESLLAGERTTCGNNMAQLDAAAHIHSQKHGLSKGAQIPPEEVYSYLKGDVGSLTCPAGGTYTYGVVGQGPKCTVHGALVEIRETIKKERQEQKEAVPKSAPLKRADTLPAARALALRAASAFFLWPDAPAFQSALAEDADWKGLGSGSATRAVDEIRRSGDKIAEQVSVKEILFCVKADVPTMKQRFPVAANLWKPDRVPSKLKNQTSFACIVVYHRLENIGDPDYTADELNELVVFVFDRTPDGYKIVHIDDLP
jgi:hypothetical protein